MAAPDPDPAPDPVELDLGWSLRVVLRAYLDAANEAFADIPSGPRGYALLVHVVRGEPGSQLALARRLGLDRTVMTYLVDDLVEAGLLERQVDPTDRRARVLVPTTRTRRLLPALDRQQAVLDGGQPAATGSAACSGPWPPTWSARIRSTTPET